MDPLLLTTAATVVAGACAALCWRHRVRQSKADTADLRQQLSAERHAAHYDPLTGLLSRRTFYQLGAAQLADPGHKRLIAVMVNLDDFRKINEGYGHVIGDQLLNTLARRFADYTTGNLVGRLNGDEFVALVTAAPTPGGNSYPDTRSLSRILATPIWASGHYVSVTATVALADVNGATDLDEVLRRADAILRRAKSVQQQQQPTIPMFPPVSVPRSPGHRVVIIENRLGAAYRNIQLLAQRRRRRVHRTITVRLR